MKPPPAEPRASTESRRLRWLGFAAALALGLIVAALLIAPNFIDWNRYREDVAGEIEQKLGRKVSIEGPLSLSLLPAPHLVAEHIRIANIPGATDPDFASVARLELKLHTGPLLAGRFEVSSLVLVKPEIHLERLADGRPDWILAPAPDIHRHGPNPDESAGTSRRAITIPAGSAGAMLERLELVDARIDLRLPRIGLVQTEGIHAVAETQGADGPFHLHGDGRIGTLPVTVEGSIGELDHDETPVDLAFTLGDGVLHIGLGGVLAGRDDATALSGRLTVKAAHLKAVAALLGLGAMPDGPVEIRSPVVANVKEFSAQGLAADLPGASLSGYAAVNFEGDPQLDVKLATPRFDLAPWLGAALSKSAAAAPKTATGPDSAAADNTILPAMTGFLIKPPTWLSTSIDLSAESILWHQALIRGARLNALIANGEVTINQVGATLPGGTQVNLFGFIDAAKGTPSFDGSFESGTDDLRSLLSWLHVDVGDVPGDRLGAARFNGHLVVTPERLKLDGAELRVDGTRITTAVDLRLPSPGMPRPALGASFAIDTLNADAYRPRHATAPAATTPGPAAVPSSSAASPTAAALPDLGPWLAAFDANIKGHIDRVVAGGITVSGVDLDGSLSSGALTLKSLAFGDIEGAHATVAGTIANLDGAPRADALKLDLHADDAHRLLTAFGLATVPDGLLALDATAQLDGDANTLTVQGHGASGGLSASLNGTVTNVLGTPGFDLTAAASQTSLTSALALAGLNYQRPAGKQPVSAGFRAHGDLHALTFDDLRLTVGATNATGHAAIALGDRSRLDLTLATDTLPLDAFFGGTVPVAASAPAAETPARPQTTAPGDPTAPKAVPRTPVAVGGIPDRFSRAPIDLDWMQAWDGTLAVDAQSLTWGALHMNQAAAALTLAGGKLTLDTFKAKLWGGDLSGSAGLGADGALACSAQLANAELKQALLGVADLDLVDGTFSADATVTSAGHSLAEFVGRLSGSGKIAAHDGVLKGFDLKAADERLKTPSAASLVTLLAAGAKGGQSGGQTRFSALTGTIKATDGVLTTDDLTMTAEGGTMTATGAVNLPAYAIDSHTALHLASAPQAPPLVMRISGVLDNPRRVLDINPLETWLAQRPKG